MPRLAICSRDLHWQWINWAHSTTQWRCQCSAWRGWPSHSMCFIPHWQVGLSWFHEKLSPANREQRLSRWADFAKKLSPANWVQGVTVISQKISRSWAPKKWGPTCDRDISNSAIYATAIYRAYTVLVSVGQSHDISLWSILSLGNRSINVEMIYKLRVFDINWCLITLIIYVQTLKRLLGELTRGYNTSV